MAGTTTLPLALGAPAPESGDLLGTDGKSHSISSLADYRLLAVVFISTGCPTVRAYEDRLVELQRRYGDELQLVAVNSNNPHLSPGDAFQEMVKRAEERQYPFLYLKDERGTVAQAFGAICTPHAFLFDAERSLRYRGRIDDARDPHRVTSPDLENAIQDLLAGRHPALPTTDPFGCAIVW